MQEDMRKRTRVRFKTTVNLSAAEKSMTDLTSRNLSLKGVYVETEEKLPIGTPVDLNIHLAGASSQVSLKMKGKVARVDSQGLGVDFVEIDLDSFVHLRNIVIYNADSPDEVDDELACIPAFQTENNYG